MNRHVRVEKKKGQDAIQALRKSGAFDREYDIINEGDYLCIPVLEDKEVPEGMETVLREGRARRKKDQPEGIKGSYDIIGSIVLMKRSNTRDPIKVARAVLQRPGIKSVFLDHGVHGENRTRRLELIAGEDNRIAMYRENGIVLRVDVCRAYFSPRLATERMVVSGGVRDGDFIIDMFAGIGPFSILIARNHACRIVAMDHNESAISLLRDNMGLNRLKGTIEPVQGDAREKISEYRNADRIIMNLPHGAYAFVGSALKALKPGGILNFYEVTTVEGIAERMAELREMGLTLVYKREVHGYSRDEYMYSLELVKTGVE